MTSITTDVFEANEFGRTSISAPEHLARGGSVLQRDPSFTSSPSNKLQKKKEKRERI